MLNGIAEQNGEQQGTPARARNSYVVCSLDDANGGAQRGLYVLTGKDQQWVTSQPNNPVSQAATKATVTIEDGSCFALKDKDQHFKVISPDEFKQKKKHKEIFLTDFRSESAVRRGLFSEFESLPRGNGDLTRNDFRRFLAEDPGLFDNIDFCQVLPPGMEPDRTIIASLTLKSDDSSSSRQFYELRGGLAQDAEHSEVYYLMKPHVIESFAHRIREKWDDRLLQFQQNKLQKSSRHEKSK